MLKIAFDIGGILSKYPEAMRTLISRLRQNCEIHIITDLQEGVCDLLKLNDFHFAEKFVHSADFKKHGSLCKAILCKELGIDILIDDHAPYLEWDSQLGDAPMRLLMLPDSFKPYCAPTWKVQEGISADWGRECSQKDLME